MSDLATAISRPPAASLLEKKMKKSHAMISGGVVLAAMVIGIGYIVVHVSQDFSGVTLGSYWPYALLTIALLIALGFEFVNGFHDTANAVATVIYTHSLEPNFAVVWSGLWNLLGVLQSSGAVAFTVITLLPVELILQVSSGAGYPWSLHCSSPPFCGIWARGGLAFPPPVRTPWWGPSSAWASPIS